MASSSPLGFVISDLYTVLYMPYDNNTWLTVHEISLDINQQIHQSAEEIHQPDINPNWS